MPEATLVVPDEFHTSKLSRTVLPSASASASVAFAWSVGVVSAVKASVAGLTALAAPGLVLYVTDRAGSGRALGTVDVVGRAEPTPALRVLLVAGPDLQAVVGLAVRPVQPE